MGRFFLFLFLFSLAPLEAGPLSERVIFTASRNRFPKLYICRSDGRDLRRFSDQLGTQTDPSYSRALNRVFYVRNFKGRDQVCSVDEEGEDFRLEVDLRANARCPDVSPDGQKLLFITDMWGAYELAEMDLKSRRVERLTYDQGINTYPAYSPDGTRIVFLSRRSGQSELYLLDLETERTRRLTDTPFHKGIPAWNPSGSRVVSTEAVPPELKSVLFELDLETDKIRYLLPRTRDVSAPTYSVDGTQILFVEEDTLFTFDPSDTTALPFPLKGNLYPEQAIWVEFPLP